jgi:hypothetical protein
MKRLVENNNAYFLSPSNRVRLHRLLSESDLSPETIGTRIGKSKSTVLLFNKEENIRKYVGRTHWFVGSVKHEGD